MTGTAQDQDQGRIVASGEGQAYDVMGATIRARLDTRGFSVIDDQEAAGGGGVPVHRHRDHDELLYVIEGEVTFKIGEQLTRGSAGTLVVGTHRTRPRRVTGARTAEPVSAVL